VRHCMARACQAIRPGRAFHVPPHIVRYTWIDQQQLVNGSAASAAARPSRCDKNPCRCLQADRPHGIGAVSLTNNGGNFRYRGKDLALIANTGIFENSSRLVRSKAI